LAHIAAAKAAKDAGVFLSYDPNLRLPLWPSADSAREGILSIWETADIIKVLLLSMRQNIYFLVSNCMFRSIFLEYELQGHVK
jgi:fructokinase